MKTSKQTLVAAVVLSSALAPSGNAATAAATHKAAAPPQVMYKDIVRPNGQKRSDAVYQADVDACYRQTGGSVYLPDSAAMKKCMLGDGFQFVWQRGFGSGSGAAVASSSGSSDYDYTPPPDTSASDAISWANQQAANQALQQAADDDALQVEEMNETNAAVAAQNALAEDMTNQYMMNEVNSR